MTQGYGPQDPNQPDYGQQPPQSQPPYGGQPPPYGTPASPATAPPAPGRRAATSPTRPATTWAATLANWPQRVGAYLIDDLIAGIPAFLAVILFSGTDPGETAERRGRRSIAFLLYLLSLGIWIYNRSILMGRTGQSWGKQVLKLRLVRMADGQPMGGGMCLPPRPAPHPGRPALLPRLPVADLGRQAPVPVLRQDHEHGGAVRGLTQRRSRPRPTITSAA